MTPKYQRIGEQVRLLLQQNFSYREIQQRVGCCKATISYHAKRQGKAHVNCKYDWLAVQNFIDSGNGVTACIKRFGMARSVWYNAVRKHKIIPSSYGPPPLVQLLIEHGTTNRGHLKNRLIREGVLTNKCELCGLDPSWNGKVLVLRLDHINGVNDDYRLSNLRLLCPNCDSQTETFAGRNVKRRKR